MQDKNIVEYVAKLSRIEVSDQEKDFLGTQLNDILAYIDKLNQVDVQGVAPLRGLHTDLNTMREDVVEKSSAVPEILKNAMSLCDTSFKIPKVLE